MRLVFDCCLTGFARWCRSRLEALGFEVVIPPRMIARYDEFLARYARERGAIIVTTDRSFCYEPKIVLPTWFEAQRKVGKPKYEKLYTILIKHLSNLKLKRSSDEH